ncbi:unnamed protein product [Musa textilis]
MALGVFLSLPTNANGHPREQAHDIFLHDSYLLQQICFLHCQKMNKAVSFLRQMGIVLAALLKAKTLAVKNKAGLTKTRLAFLGMLSKRKVLASAVSNKIHALKGHDGGGGSGHALEGYSKAMVMYNAAGEEEVFSSPADHRESLEYVEEDEYPDCGSDDEDEDDELMDSPCSAMDLVRSSEEDGLEFNLEGEIDRAADVFIRRFRREMRLQAQESPKK